ncbi:MAG TPA: TlpA disulfide reductase family protein [Opitutales bacterium]|jgi:thiol-disulfide isomerase/thioredoxin|nr:TlpA disulfide reductase family protein [Opitutales bacterium]
MKTKTLALIALAGGLLPLTSLPVTAQSTGLPPLPVLTPNSSNAPSTAPATVVPKADIKSQAMAIVAKINTKIQAGANTPDAFAAELKDFDTLLAAHKDEKTDDVAQVAVFKALLYLQVFDEPDQGVAMLKQITVDFPNTPTALKISPQLPQLEAQIKSQAAALAIKKSLVVGAQFPEFPAAITDLAGKPLAIANYKGKVLLVDFWATWCPPCVAEMPNVIAAYNKYHDKGFEIIGVSLDDETKNGRAQLTDYIAKIKMPWVQFYDGKYWQNQLAVKYGIESIPQSYLLGPDGKIIALSPRGPALAPAIEKALGISHNVVIPSTITPASNN